ncbi:MAG: hypothetical protein ACFNVO_09170, partial [Prevotella sp.]
MHNLSFGLGFLVILSIQDIQEQQETIKKSLVPPIKPIAKEHQVLPSMPLLTEEKDACTGATRVFVLSLQGACT